jgi:hypothetical protein
LPAFVVPLMKRDVVTQLKEKADKISFGKNMDIHCYNKHYIMQETQREAGDLLILMQRTERLIWCIKTRFIIEKIN